MDRFIGPETGNRESQQLMAEALLASYGYDEALEMCREFHWEGVLRALSRARPDPAPRTESISTDR